MCFGDILSSIYTLYMTQYLRTFYENLPKIFITKFEHTRTSMLNQNTLGYVCISLNADVDKSRH